MALWIKVGIFINIISYLTSFSFSNQRAKLVFTLIFTWLANYSQHMIRKKLAYYTLPIQKKSIMYNKKDNLAIFFML